MKILAFDTSFAAVSACVRVDGAERAWRHSPTARGHAELLLPMLAETLAAAGVAASGIDRVAFVRGPGHFTGLRAGIAAAQGYALALGAELAGFDAFETVAAQMAPPEPGERRLIVFDSKRTEAFFKLDGEAPGAIAAADFAPDGDAFLIGGDLAAVFADALRTRGKRVRIDATAPLPDARTVARLAESGAGRGNLAPLYIHPPATSVPKRP